MVRLSSLDNFFHDRSGSESVSKEEKEKFERWVSSILSEPQTISSMIENALKHGMRSEWEKESLNHKFKLGSYYPSIIERCLRQQAYSFLYPQAPTQVELAIFSEGRAIHELIALALRRSGLISVEGSEVVVDLNFNEEAKLHGRIDDLLLMRMTEAGDNFRLYIPLEIKSTSALPEEPKQSHYYQLTTYLLAENYPVGVLLYWVKREGKVKAFTITKEDAMYSVLRERVFELHEALKKGGMPQKEASANREYAQCERCSYLERCNPYLIDAIPRNSKLSIFDLESSILDTSEKKRAIMRELGLSSSMRPSDIHDEETKKAYWQLFDNPRFVEFDRLVDGGRAKVSEEVRLGRVAIGISSARHDNLREATEAKLANLGVPISHLILRESGNYETDGKFKSKWALRLGANYDVVEFFDRDAVTSSTVLKSLRELKEKESAGRTK